MPRHEQPEAVAVVDHMLARTSPWQHLLDLLAPPVCEDEADEQLPIAQ